MFICPAKGTSDLKTNTALWLRDVLSCRYILGDSKTAPTPSAAQVAGLILLASAPPAGNGTLVQRTLRRTPVLSIRLTW